MRPGRGRQILAVILIGAAAWFLGRAIVVNWDALQAFDWQVRPGLFITSIVVHVGVLAWGVWVWSCVLQLFRAPPIRLQMLLRIWFLSNLARYIPGKIFQFLAAVQLGRGTGLPADLLLASLLLHTGFALLAAVVLSSWTLADYLLPGVSPAAVGLLVTGAAIGIIHPALLNRGIRLGSRLLRRPLLQWHGNWAAGLALLLLSILSWGFYGFAYALFIASLTTITWSAVPLLAGVNALSFVAGYAAIVAPGGLGVREAAMTGLLLPLLPPGVAAVVAIVSRLWTIVAELIGGVLFLRSSRRSGDSVEGTRNTLSEVG